MRSSDVMQPFAVCGLMLTASSILPAATLAGMAVPAVFEDAYGIAGQQKVPCHLAVFSREFGESMRDDHHATEHARSAVLTQRIARQTRSGVHGMSR